MIKIIFTLIFIVSASIAFSQVTLTSAFNPVPGNVEAWAICDTTNIVPGNSGPGQTWNFTSLTTQDTVTVVYFAAGSTPYAAQFPGANIASTTDTSTFTFGTTSANNLLVNGSGSPDLILRYTDPQVEITYPFSFGTSFTDNFSANYTVGTAEIFETGTTGAVGDAWGTINLPGGSFSNALRVKHTMVTRDSSNMGIPFIVITNVTTYSWFVPGRKFRVFGIVYTSATINGGPASSSKYVNYNNNSTTIGIRNLSGEVPDNFSLSQNYPNPFNPSTNIKFAIPKSGLVNLTIYDAIGRKTETILNQHLQNGNYEVNWNAEKYSAGTYFYKLQSEGFIDTKKMILVK